MTSISGKSNTSKFWPGSLSMRVSTYDDEMTSGFCFAGSTTTASREIDHVESQYIYPDVDDYNKAVVETT